jgi:hypothetical protein
LGRVGERLILVEPLKMAILSRKVYNKPKEEHFKVIHIDNR